MVKIANLCNNGSLNYAGQVCYVRPEDTISFKRKGFYSEHRENLVKEEHRFSHKHIL